MSPELAAKFHCKYELEITIAHGVVRIGSIFFISDSHTAWTTLWPLHCPKFSGTVSISFRDNIASSIRIWTVSITGNILYFLLVSEVSIYLTIPKELFTLTWENEGNYVRVVTQFF